MSVATTAGLLSHSIEAAPAANAKEPLGYAVVDGLVIVTTADAAKKMERLGQVDHAR